MNIPIRAFDATGKEMTDEEYEAVIDKIKSEIIQVLKEHNLTIGQALNILDGVEADIRNDMYCLVFDEHF